MALPFMDLEKLPHVEAEMERREQLSLQLQQILEAAEHSVECRKTEDTSNPHSLQGQPLVEEEGQYWADDLLHVYNHKLCKHIRCQAGDQRF
jgi:hypothetical protein